MHPIVEEDIRRIVQSDLPWERLAGKTVLISGATGFIASYMVEAILALKEPPRVLALVRNQKRAADRFIRYAHRNDLQLVVQDVTALVPDNIRPDYVIHAAGQASPKFYGIDPLGTIAPNVAGTQRLLELAQRSGSAAFVMFSSSEVYGRLSENQVPTPEDAFGALDPTDLRSCYAESKRLGESLCVAWAMIHGVPAKIVRPYHTYGPGMRLDDGRVFADFTADVLAERPITLRSSGAATRSFCYLADAVIAFFTVLFRGETGRAYNVGGDNEISVRALADLLVRLYPERRLTVRSEPRPADDRYLTSSILRSCPDISRIRGLGWQPTTTLADGFRRTIASYT